MRIKEVKLYQFNELSAEAKERAREWYRGLQNFDFSENVIDDAKEQLKLLGFEVDEIYWSGFWSQGDGACFTGTWKAKNVNAEQLAKDCPSEWYVEGVKCENKSNKELKRSSGRTCRYCQAFSRSERDAEAQRALLP